MADPTPEQKASQEVQSNKMPDPTPEQKAGEEAEENATPNFQSEPEEAKGE